MRLMIACLAAALAVGGVAGQPARAQTAQPEALAPPSDRQLELTRRYINLMMSDQFEEAIRQVIAGGASTDLETRNLPEEDRRFLVDLTAELTTDMMPQMMEQMVPVYARALNEAELEALIAFYDTEMGRAIIAKTTSAMPEATQAAMSVMPQMLDKMAARICQHYGCEPGELEEMQREMRGETAAAPRSK